MKKPILITAIIVATLAYLVWPRVAAVKFRDEIPFEATNEPKGGFVIGSSTSFPFPVLVMELNPKSSERSLNSSKLNSIGYRLGSFEEATGCIGCQFDQQKVIAFYSANEPLTVIDKWTEVPRGLYALSDSDSINYYSLKTPDGILVAAYDGLFMRTKSNRGIGNPEKTAFFESWLQNLGPNQKAQALIEFLPHTDIAADKTKMLAFLNKYGAPQYEDSQGSLCTVTLSRLPLAGLIMAKGDLSIYHISQIMSGPVPVQTGQ